MQTEEKRQYDRDYYAAMSPERKRRKQDLMTLRRKAIVAEIREYKALMGCLNCSECDPVCLDFHHADNDKEINVADALARGWSVDRVHTEIAKCVVLCANCHRKHHAKIVM